MAHKLALFLSYTFQPLLIPTLIFVFLLFGIPEVSASQYYNEWFILMMVFVTTFVIPVLSLLTMKLTGNIGSIHLENRDERVFPFSTVSLFYGISTYLFYLKFEIEPVFILALASITICVILLTSVTFFWKISAHMTGIAGFLAIIIVIALKNPAFNLVNFLLAGIILSGSVASSRLYLNAHTPIEIFGGFLLGFSVCFGTFYSYL
ncbi:phosphatase PAP2 family protein [Cognataquiflexum aquatile]|uniref:phosphatase PAP2 family protein n=1 Tax=Cognataquiflexum aquatile TaxID=2249427 RepID=UPI001E35F0A0|nr:phosphatase PAP2 family protein [Cognataquiflexum aquatile]